MRPWPKGLGSRLLRELIQVRVLSDAPHFNNTMNTNVQTTRATRRATLAKSAKKVTVDPRVDARLRRIVAKVLDELKSPTAIPSTVILAALHEARGDL